MKNPVNVTAIDRARVYLAQGDVDSYRATLRAALHRARNPITESDIWNAIKEDGVTL